jgi:c-di-GMP-binding flagellar brake protein YcgR
MHLVYPNALRTNLVRKSARVATEVVATAKSAGNNRSITCTIRDLSLTGAMIQSAQMSVEVGTILEVAFRLANEKKPTLIELEARVRNVQQSGMGDRQVQKIGLEFMPLSESVERALELYIYRQLVQEI